MAVMDEMPHQAAALQPIDIASWTEQATAAMGSVTIATPGEAASATTVKLAIPLDDDALVPGVRPVGTAAAKEGGLYKRKAALRRDSMDRREALLKGQGGVQAAQEMGEWYASRLSSPEAMHRLINNPHAEPPTPRDWEVHPTHRVKHVPYYLAPLWDAGLRRQHNERTVAVNAQKAATKTVANKPTAPGVVPKELREKLKRSRGAKGLLMDLESEVRKFVQAWEEKERRAEQEGLPTDPDSEDDEIVFVGRNGQTHDQLKNEERINRELMLFETPEDDMGGNFGRWLVHHIGVYYGLSTWSVTVGMPARREAYIGLKDAKLRSGSSGTICKPMPTPLWVIV